MKTKRILSVLLVLAVTLALLPNVAFAGDNYTITNGTPESAKETNHGYITIDKATAAEGDTVTVSVNPATGYQLKSLTGVPTISTIPDVLATVEGFPQGTGNKQPPSNAWVCGDGHFTFVYNGVLIFYSRVDDNATAVPLTTTVTQGENGYTSTYSFSSSTTTLKFEMTDGKLTGIVFSSTNEGSQNKYGGIYTSSAITPAEPETITPEKQTDGTYQFTMPAYAVTVKAEFEKKAITIADIIATYNNFPLTKDEDLYWTNEQGTACYYFNNNLFFRYTTIKSLWQSMTVNVTADGKNYTYSDGTVTYTFIMNEDSGVLAAIVVSGSTDTKYNGTYVAPPTKYTVTNGTNDAHGDIAIDKVSAAKGETVTITVNPAEGYKLKDDSLNVRKTVTAGPHGLPITLTQDTQDKTKYTFTMPDYAVTVKAEFEEIPHSHSFNYTANNGKLTATCTDGCTGGYDTTPLTLTLTAPASLDYDGNAKIFTFADGEADAWTGAGLELPTITYYQKYSGQGWYTSLEEAPVNASGDYMAEIVANNKAAQVIYTINKATPYIKNVPEPHDITYGQTLNDSTLSGGYAQISSTDSTQVGGLFEWTNGDTKPAVSDSETTEYDVTFTPSGDYEANFITATCKVKVKVERAKTAVEPTATSELVYDGTEQNGCLYEGSFVTVAGTKSAKSAGDYSFTATPDANYAWSDGTADTKTYNWKIAQKSATVKAADVSVRTGSTAPEFKVEFTDLLDADVTAVTEGFSPVFKLMTTGEAPEEISVEDALKTPGEYTIVIANAGDLDAFTNYSFTVNNGKLTVTRRSSGGGGGSSSYTIKFETNGGETLKNVSVRVGQKIGTIETPKKDGFVFDGWFSDKELTKPFNADEKVTKSTTLYAKWKVDPVRQIILTIDKKEAFVFTEEKVNDVAPKIVNDRTMLPIRFIAEALGAKVDWNGEKELVTISNEDFKIEITIGKDVAFVNGKEIKLDSPAFIENDRTYLPLRFVAENLGANVEWFEESQQVVITKAIPEKTTTK